MFPRNQWWSLLFWKGKIMKRTFARWNPPKYQQEIGEALSPLTPTNCVNESIRRGWNVYKKILRKLPQSVMLWNQDVIQSDPFQNGDERINGISWKCFSFQQHVLFSVLYKMLFEKDLIPIFVTAVSIFNWVLQPSISIYINIKFIHDTMCEMCRA